MKTIFTLISILLITFGFNRSFAQDYSFDDFVGTWNGSISRESSEGYNDPITMTIEEDGFYTETSGHMMPTIYPNTQESEYDAETNRYHWWYLKTVYAGQYFYQHFFMKLFTFRTILWKCIIISGTIRSHIHKWAQFFLLNKPQLDSMKACHLKMKRKNSFVLLI